MIKCIRLKQGSAYIHEEKGNLYVKDKEGNSRPVIYGAYLADMEALGLWEYKNIRDLWLMDAVKELDDMNAVLMTNRFEIGFYDEKDMIDFVNRLEKY